MGSLGPMEIILIFLAILLIFGAKRIPEIARGMGKGIKEFKSATREITNELTIDEPAKPRVQTRQPAQGTPEPRSDAAAAPPAPPAPAASASPESDPASPAQ